MSPWHALLYALILTTSSGPAAAAPDAGPGAAAPPAIVAAVKGRADVTPAHGGAAVRATFGRALATGDRIVVGAGGSLTLFFRDGNVIELGEKSTLTIGGRAAAKGRAAAGGELAGEVYANVNRFATGGSRETGLVGVTPMRSSSTSRPLLLEPRRTNLLETRPRLRWRAVEGATGYRVVCTADAGELWRRDVADTTLEYPANEKPLAPGTDVSWSVAARTEHDELRREETTLHVLDADEARHVEEALRNLAEATGANRAAGLYLEGSYLSGRGLFGAAAGRFEALRALDPAATSPHESLGDVYRAIGLSDLAAEEYRRALELSRVP